MSSSGSSGSESEDEFDPLELEAQVAASLTGRRSRSHRHSHRHSSRRRARSPTLVEAWLDHVLDGAHSVQERFNIVTSRWQGERNRKAAMVYARLIDALCRGDAEAALEIAVRRLAGIQSAEQSGSWSLSNVLENNTEQQAFLPSHMFSSFLKMAARLDGIRKSNGAGAGAGGAGSSSGKDGPFNKKGGGGGTRKDGAGGGHDAKPSGSAPK